MSNDETSDARLGSIGDALLKRTAFISEVAVIAVVLTALHELGFYSIVGFDLITTLVLTDYLKLGLLWIPPVLIANFIAFYIAGGLGLPFRRLFESKSDDTTTNRSARYYGSIKYAIVFILSIVIVVASFYVSIRDFFALAAVLGAMLMFFLYLFFKLDASRIKNWADMLDLFIIPAIFTFSIIYGITDGIVEMRSDRRDYSLILNDTDTTLNVHLMKISDSGVLFSQQPFAPVFIPWGGIKRIARHPSACLTFPFASEMNIFQYVAMRWGGHSSCYVRSDNMQWMR